MNEIVSNDAFHFYTRNEKVGEVSKCGKVRVTSKTFVRSNVEKKERNLLSELVWKWKGRGKDLM